VAVLQNNLQQSSKDQQSRVVTTVVDLGTKVDTMSTNFSALQESVADISSRLGKLQQQMVDISNAVRTMQTPAAAPPAATPTGGPPGGAPGAEAAGGGIPPIPAQTLYANAYRDKNGGKADMALQEFGDYLKYYGNTEMAPNAQFYIAEIHLNQNQLDDALQGFDLVLEKYPDNSKTADALYMKGFTLVKMGKRTLGKQEFCEVVKRFPTSDLAARSKTQVKNLGLTCGAATPARRKKS